MKQHRLLPLCLSLLAAAATMIGCSGKGADVIDPGSSDRKEVAIIAVEKTGGAELMRFNEATSASIPDDYQTANGEALGKNVDAMYAAYDKLYLLHRATGEITVLDAKTRGKLAVIVGFPSGSEGELCGMAFSNSTNAWVVCHGSNQVYLVDIETFKFVRGYPLPGNPTSVGTAQRRVAVGMVMPDGSSQVAVFNSNASPNYPIEETLHFPTPIVHIVGTPDGANLVFLSAGNQAGDAKPTVYYILTSDLHMDMETPIEAGALTEHIGDPPTYAAFTRQNVLYVATSTGLALVDTQQRITLPGWVPGDFDIVGADPFSSFIYLLDPAYGGLRRIAPDGNEYETIQISDPVRAVAFLNSNVSQ